MDRQMAAIQAQREAREFNAWLQMESQKRAQAWEQEKIEIAARNRFAMEEQAFMWEQQLRNKERLQAMQERQRKLKVIRKLEAEGELSEEEARRAMIGIETGLAPGMYETGGSAWEKAIFQMMKPELHERGITAEDAERVAAMPAGNLVLEAIQSDEVDPESKVELIAIVKRGTPEQVKAAARTYFEFKRQKATVAPAAPAPRGLPPTGRPEEVLVTGVAEPELSVEARNLLALARRPDVPAEVRRRAEVAVAMNDTEEMRKLRRELSKGRTLPKTGPEFRTPGFVQALPPGEIATEKLSSTLIELVDENSRHLIDEEKKEALAAAKSGLSAISPYHQAYRRWY